MPSPLTEACEQPGGGLAFLLDEETHAPLGKSTDRAHTLPPLLDTLSESGRVTVALSGAAVRQRAGRAAGLALQSDSRIKANAL